MAGNIVIFAGVLNNNSGILDMSRITIEVEFEATVADEGADAKEMAYQAINNALCGLIKNDDEAIIRVTDIEQVYCRKIEYDKL